MGFFTRAAMDALMKTTHPEINRRQCWNLHPHRKSCTACKDICPYGDQIFTRPNLVKDWDPCTDCGLCVSVCRSRCISPRRSRWSATPLPPTPTTIPSGSAVRSRPAKTPWCAPASRPFPGRRWPIWPEQKDRAGPDPLRRVRERHLRRPAAGRADPPGGVLRGNDVRGPLHAGL